MSKFMELVPSNSVLIDEHERRTTKQSYFVKERTILAAHVVSVVDVPSQIVEGYGHAPVKLSKIETVRGDHIVVGSRKEVEKTLFGESKRILKG